MLKNPLTILAFAAMVATSAQALGAELLTKDQLGTVTAGWYSGNPGAGAGGLGTPGGYYNDRGGSDRQRGVGTYHYPDVWIDDGGNNGRWVTAPYG